jgi:DnaJ domain
MSSDVRRQGGREPHDVLGVPKGADRQQVVRAFRRTVRRGHPDTGGDAQTFEEIVRARDVLLGQAGHADDADDRRTQAAPSPNVRPRPTHSPPRETSRLAIATAVLALLGPVLWPAAIVIGHVALRRIERTGQGGGTFVVIVLFFLYLLTLPVLLQFLSLIVIR